MEFTEFVSKSVVQRIHYVTDLDPDKQEIHIFFEDGTRADFSFDDWFCLLETAYQIVSMNTEINAKLESD